MLNYNPHARYYGGVAGSIYYSSVVSSVWHWTGNKNLARQYIRLAVDALAWADRYLLDDSGFYRYLTRSKQGERNQGWKDSNDAIVHADGSQVKDPLGTCEMQGFVYASKMHLSEVLWWLDDSKTARRLLREAEQLKKRFNDLFWIEDAGYFGMAIDAEKTHRAIDRIGSLALPRIGNCRSRADSARCRSHDAARYVLRLGHPHTFREQSRI